MSEELLQTIPQQVGRYTYYRLGATTLDQLRNNGIIPKKDYQKLKAKKPDGLVMYHGEIKAVVEYKQPKDLVSEKQIVKAIKQEIDVAKALCKIFIVTDSSKSIWVNALNGERIRDAKGQEVNTVFHPFAVKNTSTLEYLLDEIDASLTRKNSTIRSAKLIDPTPLASRLWQTIWVATGKSPVKCLYNVVELFIFKFLSDLQVLGEDFAFNRIYKMALDDPEEALEYYAKNTRSKIYKLFPHGKDGTTIINGTIFVTETGEPNLSQSILFFRSLDHLRKYSEEFGSLTKINKQFKTKLYESFLQQEVEALGQYFTPRKVVQSMIRMAGLDSPSFQFAGKRICDPYCGVGGFPLEILNLNESMLACYTPDADCGIAPPFVLNGFDKGFERDDERTIILAKANMLIYLAELLFTHPQCSREFAQIFNDTFTLFQDNLGTFGHIIKEETEKYDYILSNPPYVTSGSSIIKEEISKTARTANEYPINALGLEGLSVEWIVKSLKTGGKAFVVIPDGILGRVSGKKLRDYILRECYLDAIISLPVRTFFANFEHTYILAITKKHRIEDVQTEPVFTYLVSNIGEKLTSVKREEIAEDDLPEMEGLFKIFLSRSASKELLEKQSPRCKIQDIQRFRDSSHWVINRWWTREEREALGSESPIAGTRTEIDSLLEQIDGALEDYDQFISNDPLEAISTSKEVALGTTELIKLFIGRRYLTKEVTQDTTKIPVYSANVFAPMGFTDKSKKKMVYDYPAILWGIDGNFDFNLVPAGFVFAPTDHCGVIQILDHNIVPEYLLYALNMRRIEESFDRSFRASLTNMRQFTITIPTDENGDFDVAAQKLIANRYTQVVQKKEKLEALKEKFDGIFSGYIASTHAT